MSKCDNTEHNREMMVDSIMSRRDEPTHYRAPETDQKWRARNVISFHFRHFAWKAPPAYRDVLLCAIDHANPTTGRCDARQRTMARECNLSRETVNRALRWWEVNTAYLGIENRGPGRSNAYHIQWRNLETDWHEIQERIRDATPTSLRRHADRGVTTHITGGVITDITGGVITDVTPRTLKGNRKEEPHPEWDHQPSAAESTHSSINERESLESPTESQQVESQREHSGEDRATLTAEGLTAAEKLDRELWTKWLRDWEAALKVCTDPAERTRLEASIQRARNKLNEQRDETAASAS